MPGRGVARGLQLEHVGGQIDDGLLAPPPSAAPTPCRRCCASVGRALRAADVLLHQLDLRARHVDLRAAVELELQVLFGPAVLLQQLQPAIAADAVREMDDEVAFAQFEKAVDRPRLPPPRRPRQILPLKQLARADQHHLLRHDPKPGFQMPNDKLSRDGRRTCALGATGSPVPAAIAAS